jgi:hypothetical protein
VRQAGGGVLLLVSSAVGRFADAEKLQVHDPDHRLPEDQSSWRWTS